MRRVRHISFECIECHLLDVKCLKMYNSTCLGIRAFENWSWHSLWDLSLWLLIWGPSWWHPCKIYSTRPEGGPQATTRPNTPGLLCSDCLPLLLAQIFWVLGCPQCPHTHATFQLLFFSFIISSSPLPFYQHEFQHLNLWMPDPCYHQHPILVLLCHSSNTHLLGT